MEPQTITVEGVAVTVVVTRKRVKNVNARLDGTTVRISAPFHVLKEELDQAIQKLARTLLRRVRAQQVNLEEDALELARRIATRFPRAPQVKSVTFVTSQHARWGSYSPRTGMIRLNAGLRTMPRWVLEAVMAHELAHAIHLRHSRAFWDLLRLVCPDTERARAFLAGVSWLGGSWHRLPPVERSLLVDAPEEPDGD